MALILDRAEFYALAVLHRAPAIVGLDPAALVSADSANQQSSFVQGRDQLRDRDLIRLDGHGGVDLEHDLRDLFTVIVAPEQVVMTVRLTPGGERHRLMFYGRDDVFVELTIPRTGLYRLARIGSADAMIARLLELLPIADRPFVPESLTLAGSPTAKALQLVMQGRTPDAQALLEEASPDEPTLARYLVDVFASATFAGNITLVKPTAGGVVQSSDLTLIHSPDETWSLCSSNGSDRLWAERMNASALRGTLLRAMSRVTAEVS